MGGLSPVEDSCRVILVVLGAQKACPAKKNLSSGRENGSDALDCKYGRCPSEYSLFL